MLIMMIFTIECLFALITTKAIPVNLVRSHLNFADDHIDQLRYVHTKTDFDFIHSMTIHPQCIQC